MWRLVYCENSPDAGKVLRDKMENQWEALRTAIKADGTRYKKEEALQVPSGTKIFKQTTKKISIKHDEIIFDGNLCNKEKQKTLNIPVQNEFILEEYA